MRRFQSHLVEPQSWESIEGHYIELNELGWGHTLMLSLVRQISASPLSNRLFGFTSLDKLVIGNYIPMDFNWDTLQIIYDRRQQEWLFEYSSKPYCRKEFVRKYAPEEGIQKFFDFADLMKW